MICHIFYEKSDKQSVFKSLWLQHLTILYRLYKKKDYLYTTVCLISVYCTITKGKTETKSPVKRQNMTATAKHTVILWKCENTNCTCKENNKTYEIAM